MADEERMRVDDLAAAAGIPTTTIRLYRQRKLLHPPQVVGRTGWYDDSHLVRLRLIARLQDDGFSLAGIAKLLDSWEQGQELGDLVGVEQQLDALLNPKRAIDVEPASLAERFPADSLTPELMRRAVELGLVELTDRGTLRLPDPRFLDIGSDLADLGIPLDVVLDEWEHLATVTDDVARRFIQLFEAHLLGADPASGDVGALAERLGRLQRDARQVVVASLDASLARVGAERLGALVPVPPSS